MGKTNYRLTLPLLAIMTGCSSDPVDIGDDKTGEYLADYAASWDGYAEAFEFYTGSNRLRVVLDAAGRGTVEFGDAPSLTPPTDPELPYSIVAVGFLREGFKYPAREVTVEASRLRFGVSVADLSQEWCEQQTPAIDAEVSTPDQPVYRCATSSTMTRAEVDRTCDFAADISPELRTECDKIVLCRAVCKCTADHCVIRTPEKLEDYPIRVDAALASQATELVGTLLLASGVYDASTARIAIRLTRQ